MPFEILYKTVVDVNMCSDYENAFDQALIVITESLAKRIMVLSAAVMSLKAGYIIDYDYTPELLKNGREEVGARVEGVKLLVDDHNFWWKGYLKHSDPEVSWYTDSISVEILEALLIPADKLLEHVGREWKDDKAKDIYKNRLAKEVRV